jgi:hypothetical protein
VAGNRARFFKLKERYERLRQILSKIFPSNHPAVAEAEAPAPMVAQPGATAAGSRPTPAVASAPQVDVEAVLNGMAQQSQTKLNWRTSIVDLMKLVGMDSALSARKELAQELGYTGSTSDSATLNVWLHKQVMKKIADNGGKLPDDLKA